MARRIVLIIFAILLFTVALTSPAYCNNWESKLGRGVCNMFTFPLELYTQVAEVNNNEGLFAAATWGIIKGLGMSVVRAACGVYEVVTFPFPVPADYMPILTEPEFYGGNLIGG
ncbi:MAG: exosortase system-associated protein, TIGR04073 family [Parabacteroides sp.]|nr:exosortase system-associated protein, TIGR04073 family [Parabacteroides sp.]